MKRVVRVLLLALFAALVVTGVVKDRKLPGLSAPSAVTEAAEEPVQLGNDPLVYFFYVFFFR